MYYYVSIAIKGLSVLTILIIKESKRIKAHILKKKMFGPHLKRKLSQITQKLIYIFFLILNVLEHRFT